LNKRLGERMKEYEYAYRIKMPKKSYVIIRIDGKAFHTYTKKLFIRVL
jgi:tRNA(His) 5'-end guanylyltransferase